MKARGAKLVLIGLESSGVFLGIVAGWRCLRLSYWVTLIVRPDELGFRFALERLAVLFFFASPLGALLAYTIRMEPFSWKEWKSMALALAVGLIWALLAIAMKEGSRVEFLDWSEATLFLAGLGGWILALAAIFLHRSLDKKLRGMPTRSTRR